MTGFDTVSLARCERYERTDIREALLKSLSLVDGLSAIEEGMKVGIKANLVSAADPEKAVITHPLLLDILCRMLTEKGAEVIIGDSPGGLFTPSFVKNVYRAGGYYELEKIPGVKLNDNFEISDAKYPDAVSLKSFSYTAWLRDVDVIIDFAKLKTHAMMGMSCAVKNMFGCIPGTTKTEYHMRFPEEKAFANVMVDLNEYFKPTLYIVDAIDGMEGNGPTAGEKRHIGVLLSSRKPYALDLVCAHLIGMGTGDVPTLLAAKERGLGPSDISEVDIKGDISLESARIKDFKRATIHQSITFEGGGWFNEVKSAAIKLAYNTKPQVKKDECIGCKKCFETCPAGAITMRPAKAQTSGAPQRRSLTPHINRSRCIKCFCCQEFCPVGAMKVYYNPIGKLLNKLQR